MAHKDEDLRSEPTNWGTYVYYAIMAIAIIWLLIWGKGKYKESHARDTIVADSIAKANPPRSKETTPAETYSERKVMTTCDDAGGGCKFDMQKVTDFAYYAPIAIVLPGQSKSQAKCYSKGQIDVGGHQGKVTFYGAEIGEDDKLHLSEETCVTLVFYVKH